MNRKEVRLDSTNKIGLRQIQELLFSIGIYSVFYDFDTRYRITIKDIEKFFKIVCTNHPEKYEKLQRLLDKTIINNRL